MTPLNSWILKLGGSAWILAVALVSDIKTDISSSDWVMGAATRNFQSVSPSN